MKLLTDDELKEDLQGFYDRLQDARNKLSELPETAGTWKERKKLAEKKRILNDEIRHVHRLIDIAREALTEI